MHKHYARAALFALISFSGWTVSDALLKLVREENIPLGQIFLVTGLSGVAVVFLLSALRGNIGKLQPRKWRGFIVLGLLQWGTFACWMNALPPFFVISDFPSSSVPGSFGFGVVVFEASTTLTPSAASAMESALPIPRDAPVTMAIFPSS